MRLRDFNQSIQQAYRFMTKIGLAKESVLPSSLPVNTEFNKVVFSNNASHTDIFFSGLELTHYNFILTDYSFMQFSLSVEGDEPEIRMAFYPNPMSESDDLSPTSPQETILIFEEMFNKGEINYDELSQALSEIDVNISTPIIRYDVSDDQFKRITHPYAHLHLGLNNPSRIATNKIYTPLFFTQFIVRTFFYDYWKNCNNDDFKLEIEFQRIKNNLTPVSEINYCELQKGLLNIT